MSPVFNMQKIKNGDKVIHIGFGEGHVIEVTQQRITIMFNDKKRVFKIPDSFEKGYLRLE